MPTSDDHEHGAVGPVDGEAPRHVRGSPRVTIAARVLLPVLLVIGLVTGVSVTLDLVTVRSSLVEARSALGEVRGSLAEVDLDRAAATLEVAEDELRDARSRTTRLTWSLASVAPFVGDAIDVTRDVVEVASEAVDLTGIVVTDGQQLLGDGLTVEVVDGRVDLAPVFEVQELLARLPSEQLRTATDELARPRDRWVPGPIRDGRSEVLQLAQQTLTTVDRAQALTAALPGFLGTEGPKRYFVGFQTSAELRGTGGLIGFWGILAVDDGRVVFGQSETFDPFDDNPAPEGEDRVTKINRIGSSSVEPPGTDPEYLRRYFRYAGAKSFPNINLDPDLPTTAQAILNLFDQQTGERLDGVMLIDPVGLQGLLESTGGHVPLSDGVAAELDMPDGLPVADFASFITSEVYDTYGFARSEERDQVFGEIGDTAFAQIFDGGWEGATMLRAIAQATNERHLQLYTSDTEVQEAFRRVGATGSLDQPDDADLFAVTANNIVGGKQDVHLGHEFAFHIDLQQVERDDEGRLSVLRSADLTVGVDNPLPTSGRDPYVIGSCYAPKQGNRCFEGTPGTNRTWYSVWAAGDNQVSDARSDDGGGTGGLQESFRGLRVVDHFQLTDAGQRTAFGFDFDGRAPLQREPTTVVYEFTWWRQSKATPDLLDVRIDAPQDWAIVDIEVIGGGSGRGSGVHGDGRELEVTFDDGSAHLAGTVTADTRFRVHLGETPD